MALEGFRKVELTSPKTPRTRSVQRQLKALALSAQGFDEPKKKTYTPKLDFATSMPTTADAP